MLKATTRIGAEMITIPELTAQALGSFLSHETEGRFRSSHADLTKLLPFAARLALECIGNSDALYHNIEHTMLVTLVGHDILVGRALQRTTTATDYANFILACLTHDIGYVRGIVQGDEDGAYVADISGRKIQLPVGSSDAALAPYHVDRSKLFVIERFDAVEEVDAARIARAIEYTRFPYAATPKEEVDDLNEEEGLLLRAADLIGQLGDPKLHEKIECPVSRIRGNRAEQDAGLRNTRRHRLQVPAVLLDQRGAADPACDPLSQCYVPGSPMDRQPPQQCFSG